MGVKKRQLRVKRGTRAKEADERQMYGGSGWLLIAAGANREWIFLCSSGLSGFKNLAMLGARARLSEAVFEQVPGCPKCGLVQVFYHLGDFPLQSPCWVRKGPFPFGFLPETFNSLWAGEEVTQTPTRRNGLCMGRGCSYGARWLSVRRPLGHGSLEGSEPPRGQNDRWVSVQDVQGAEPARSTGARSTANRRSPTPAK